MGDQHMRDDEESEPRTSSGSDKGKKNAKINKHLHIGPNARAYRAGLAFCPVCDADKGLRLTDKEREDERSSKLAKASKGSQ